MHSAMVPSQKPGTGKFRLRQTKRDSFWTMQMSSSPQHGSTNSKPVPPHWPLEPTHLSDVCAQTSMLTRQLFLGSVSASATADAMARAVAVSVRSSKASRKSVSKVEPVPTAALACVTTKYNL